MPANEVRVSLTAKQFPFKFDELSSTVFINRGLEQQRQLLNGFDGDEPVQSFGICQAYYMQNCLPTMRGYTAVFWHEALAQIPALEFSTDIDRIFILRDDANNVALYAPANGANYVFDADIGTWKSYPFSGTISAQVQVTHLKGVSYICYAGLGLYTYNFYTQAMEAQLPAGLNMGAIRGICAANQYLMAWDGNTLYWSSATNPLDFLPALGTGAGSTSVLAVRSEITAVLPIADGFICYTTTNAVGSTFSGDAVNPWLFREIPGSAGVAIPEYVTYDSNLEAHFAWTTSGMQQITLRRAEPVWPELTDSIARGLYSSIVSPATVPSITVVARLAVRFNTVGARFITCSVKSSDSADMFQFAYVYDIALSRWGRIDIPHTDIFEFRPPEFVPITSYQDLEDDGLTYTDLDAVAYEDLGTTLEASTVQYGNSFGVVQVDGTVMLAKMADAAENAVAGYDTAHYIAGAAAPMIIHGRYKLARPAGVELQRVQVARAASDLVVNALVHDTQGDIVASRAVTADQFASVNGDYLCRVYGDSVSLQLIGKFTLHDLLLQFRSTGTRNAPRR